MTANLRILKEPAIITGRLVDDLARIKPLLPECHPKVIGIVRGVLEYTKDLFSKGLNSTMLGRLRPFEQSGKILHAAHGQNCSSVKAGSICYKVVESRFLESTNSVWSDLVDIVNRNSTGGEFLYQARVQAGGVVCENLHVRGMIYRECEGQARNGTIRNLPLLRKLCELPQTVSQAVYETVSQARQVVVETTKPGSSFTKIFSDYVLPALPIATGLAGAWAIHKAISSHQKEGITTKTCALGLAGIAGLVATAKTLMM